MIITRNERLNIQKTTIRGIEGILGSFIHEGDKFVR